MAHEGKMSGILKIKNFFIIIINDSLVGSFKLFTLRRSILKFQPILYIVKLNIFFILTSLSSLPGLLRAGSIAFGRFVAPIITS